MENILVDASPRQELGKNASRRLRAAGRIPATLYGREINPVSVSVDPRDLYRILQSDSGVNTIFKLQVDGNQTEVLIRDYQLDPVRGELLHADFQKVAMDELMTFEIPVEVFGESVGIKAGGVLDRVMHEIEVECLPGDVPDSVEVDISHLDIGDSIRVEELQLDRSKIEVVSEADLVVVTVVPPRIEEEPEELEEEAAEPELVGEAEEGEEEAAETTDEKES